MVDAGQPWRQSQGWVNNKLDSSEPVSDKIVQEWCNTWWREEGVIERGVCHVSSSLKAVVVLRLTLGLSCALSSIYVSLSALFVKYQTCLDRKNSSPNCRVCAPIDEIPEEMDTVLLWWIWYMFSEFDYKSVLMDSKEKTRLNVNKYS